MYSEQEIYQRSEALLGAEGMKALGERRVIVFGVGGVGSWCAESLLRTGVRRLTIVDSDCVDVSNINRQLMATTETVGRPKVEVLQERLLTINPHAEITALTKRYTAETASEFALETYDYVIDCIDSLDCKLHLILHATSLPHTTLFSSMGAALKLDPTRIRVAEFWKVQGCPLARALRQKIKKGGVFPKRKFRCVFSDETPATSATLGSLSHVTAIFGFTLAGLVVQDIAARTKS